MSFFDFISDWLNLKTVYVIIICILYYNLLYRYSDNVPYVKTQRPSRKFESGLLGKKHYAVYLKEIYDKLKTKGWKYGGIYIFTETVFLPIDLDIIESIVKNFEHFQDRALLCPVKELIHPHLLNLAGETSYNWCMKLRPMFNMCSMRTMFPVMAECQHDLQNRMDRECQKNEAINIQEILASFQTNVIGSCVFGLEPRELRDEYSEFRRMAIKLFTPSGFARFKRHFLVKFAKLADNSEVEIPIRNDVARFLTNMVKNAVEYRKNENYRRDDFMQMMIDLKNSPLPVDDYEEQFYEPFTLDDFTSHAVAFYAAGFEATSALMTFVLYELARHQAIQNTLRETIISTLEFFGNNISYESITGMKYLDQVIDETLRMHPCSGFLNRKCTKDFKVPNVDLVIEKGTVVNISLLGMHYDAERFPDPEKFAPERFSSQRFSPEFYGHNRLWVGSPYSHLPFGAGRKSCHGMDFGLLQSKIGLVTLLQKYHFTVNEKTKEPIGYHPGSTTLIGEEEIWLNAQRI